jgi:hypothetical protein
MRMQLRLLVHALLCASAWTWGCSSAGSSSSGSDAGVTREAGPSGTDGSSGAAGDAGVGTAPDAGSPCGVATPGCKAGGCQVFETATTSFEPGGGASLATADQLCQTEAGTRGLTGTFKAWLSSKACSAAARFTHSAVPYVSVDNQGAEIAANWTKLVSGTLAAPINPNGYSSVATDTNSDGSAAALNCQSGSSENLTYPGDPAATDGSWTSSGAFMSCSNAYALYCFEQ